MVAVFLPTRPALPLAVHIVWLTVGCVIAGGLAWLVRCVSARKLTLIAALVVAALVLSAGVVFADTVYSPYCDGWWYYAIAACWGIGF